MDLYVGEEESGTIAPGTQKVVMCFKCKQPETDDGCGCARTYRRHAKKCCIPRKQLIHPCKPLCLVDILPAMVLEFIGTFALVLVILGSIAAGLSLTGVALTHLFILFWVVSLIGAHTGGHVNPAVTLAFLALRKISLWRALAYWVAQIVGGIAAGAVIYAFYHSAAPSLGTAVIGGGYSVAQALFVELLFTFVLVFTVLWVTFTGVSPNPALVVGVSLAVGVFAAGPISGAALNPARQLGPAVFSQIFSDHWIYWVGPAAGSLIAAGLIYGLDYWGALNYKQMEK